MPIPPLRPEHIFAIPGEVLVPKDITMQVTPPDVPAIAGHPFLRALRKVCKHTEISSLQQRCTCFIPWHKLCCSMAHSSGTGRAKSSGFNRSGGDCVWYAGVLLAHDISCGGGRGYMPSTEGTCLAMIPVLSCPAASFRKPASRFCPPGHQLARGS